MYMGCREYTIPKSPSVFHMRMHNAANPKRSIQKVTIFRKMQLFVGLSLLISLKVRGHPKEPLRDAA